MLCGGLDVVRVFRCYVGVVWGFRSCVGVYVLCGGSCVV